MERSRGGCAAMPTRAMPAEAESNGVLSLVAPPYPVSSSIAVTDNFQPGSGIMRVRKEYELR